MTKILIRDGMVLSVHGWLRPGYVLVDGEEIALVNSGGPPDDLIVDEVISLPNMAVIPGLVNAHTHLSQTFMRGLAGGRTLISWLKELIWPLQAAMSVEELRLASLLGLVENLRCGNTHVVNHHKVTYTLQHTEALFRSALESKLNVTVARTWVDTGTNAEPASEILDDLGRLFSDWHGACGKISIANGPSATWRCTEETLRASHEIAKTNGSFTHIHVSETSDEVRMCVESTGLTPVFWLEKLGLLDSSMQIVHAVWVSEAEMDKLAQHNVMVVHCPVSNAVIGSGIAPLTQMKTRGINLRLGTDGSASNDNQDLWGVVKSALSFSRATTLDPMVISPKDVLNMALSTPGLEAGQRADFIAVDLDHSRAVPVIDPTSALVLCSNGSDVDLVVVGGEVLLKNKQVKILDEKLLIQECRTAAKELYRRAGVE